jgi:hypothetical protein
LQLRNRAQLCFVHIDHPSFDDQHARNFVDNWSCFVLIPGWKYAPRSGSYLVGQG